LRRALLVLGVSAAVFASGALPASAADSVITDPNDSIGLDISRVALANADSPPPVWTISTFRTWTIAGIWDKGYFMVELDTIGGAGPEYRALVRSNGRRMLGRLYRVRQHAADVALGKLHAKKVNSRSVAVAVPLSKLTFGPDRTAYKWDVLTSFASKKCPDATCFDRAPDDGSVVQPLPGGG
jgi:hypothetical protein